MTQTPDLPAPLPPHGLGDLTNPTAWPEDRLTSVVQAAQAELQRRYVLATAPAQVEQLVDQYQSAVGRADGDPWVQPVRPVDAYRKGAVVERFGKMWESLIPNNVRPPGDTEDPQSYRWWKDLTPVTPPPDGVAAPWDPNGRAYIVGQPVTFAGKTYRARQAHTSQPGWTPVALPSLWELVT